MTGLLALGLLFALPLVFAIGSDDSPDETESDPLGTEGDDLIDNSQETEGQVYDLQGGNDGIIAGSGDDTIINDTGAAIIDPRAGNDLINGGDGVVTVRESEGDDTITGSAGNDRIEDALGLNVIDGGLGADVITAGSGSLVTGGAGVDTFSLRLDVMAESPLRITDFESGTDLLANLLLTVEGTQTGAMHFEDRPDGMGANILFNDNVIAEVMGATTTDLLSFNLNRWIMDEEGATFTSTDPNADDDIIGSQGADVIDGGAGDDRISGGSNYGAGGDVLRGGEGNDTLLGFGITEAGAPAGSGVGFITEQSTLEGGAGDDVLRSVNSNVLTGGTGADTFEIGVSDNIAIDLPPASDITDFVQGEDIISIGTNRVLLEQDVSIIPWADGTGADIMNGEVLLVRVTGGQNLSLADLEFR